MPGTISSPTSTSTPFDMRAGDILDIALNGAAGNISVYYGEGTSRPSGFWFGTDTNQASDTKGSPLQNVGTAVIAQTIPETGRYYIALAPSNGSANYTMGLRAYRPVLERAPIGTKQILYVDFDGGFYPSSRISGSTNPLGMIRFDRMEDNLGLLGFPNATRSDVLQLKQEIMVEAQKMFDTLITNGLNGDYDSTGNPGDYGITLLSSLDCPEIPSARGPGSSCSPDLNLDNNPLVTRILVGSIINEVGIPTIGIAESVDIGNFVTDEIGIVLMDQIAASAAVPLSPSVSQLNVMAKFLAGVIVHEAGHTFGERHTDTGNQVFNIMDSGSQQAGEAFIGIGPDGIAGTADDQQSEFAVEDEFSLVEGIFGYSRTAASMAHNLSTGTVGTTITGTVFNDVNRNGSSIGEPGLGGVTVFADVIQNGFIDPTEPVALTDANGNYTLVVASGVTYNIIANTPAQFAATIPTTRFAAGGDAGVDFGFAQVIPDVTGTKWADTNGNGIFDATESGVEGVYIYLDLDGDNRPDLGEPSAVTDSNGQYSINFPGPGTYTIREVVQPGFIQTFPSSGEHLVNYNGVALTDNYNFGNLPSRDYGDAPDSYQTTVATGGPSHGISTAVGLGAEVDRETNGIPTNTALGDDLNNLDDEDGVQLLSPLGPGGTASLSIETRNTTGGEAFLQGWIDFDGSGTFDAIEQVFTDISLGNGTSTLTVNVPDTAVVGSTYARFRYSPTPGLGVGGEADAGEVEDYQFDILEQAAIANDDEFTVSRNSLSNRLDVLANDFETNVTTLTIISLNETGTVGNATIIENGRAISYTPPNGFTGRDVFQYVVVDQTGEEYTATVSVNVNFQSNVPIAVDDTFDIPQGSSNRALNVLDNDVPSVAGGLTITSVTAGDQGGQVTLEGGGQTIRYTPQPGFAGTEQFFYSVEDANGSISSAQVTVNSQPGALNDDKVDFTIGVFDITNNEPISSVQVGQEFFVRVFVEELNNANFTPEGVASAFLDLLYTDELVSTNDTIDNDTFDFDITFGENFQGGGFKLGDATIPGLIDDVGAVQPIPGDGNLIQHSDPAELFTLTMTAVSPGVALFAADPADSAVAETILVGEDVALTPAEQRLGRTELTIFPASDNFASAIDDAFVAGLDSVGNRIEAGTIPNTLDVLDNDNFGETGFIQEFGLVTAPSLGTAVINNNGTPGDLSDDTIDYFANVDANGFDSFKYLIVSGDGVRSVAEVTMAIGNAADDDIVELSFGLVNEFGAPISTVGSGETFGVQVFVEDLRSDLQGNTYVFAAYQDILYDSGLINPVDVPAGGRFDFDVEFDADFDESAGVGTAVRRNIIDEFGSLLLQTVAEGGGVAEPNLMATVFFTAATVGTTTQTQVIGSPADASPFQDTLLFDRDEPVEVSQIRYNALDITITPGGSLQNTALPEDVNADGVVTPSDALTIINTLARGGEGEFVFGQHYYTDVNGDQQTTAIDALHVINHLALMAAGQQAEGESVAALAASNTDSSDEGDAVDEAITDLSSGAKLVSSGSSDGGSSSQASVLALADSDDEEDDLLTLLADDQSGLA